MDPLPTSPKPSGQPASRASSSSSIPADSAAPAQVGHKRPASAMAGQLPARPSQQPRGHSPLPTGHALQALATRSPHGPSPTGPSSTHTPTGPSWALDDEIQPAPHPAVGVGAQSHALHNAISPEIEEFFAEHEAAQQARSAASPIENFFKDYEAEEAEKIMRAAMQAILEQQAQPAQQAQQAPAVPTTPVLLGHLQARIHDANDNSYSISTSIVHQ
jgi:hypothetical protein